MFSSSVFIFLMSLLKFSLGYSILPLSSLSIFITNVLNSAFSGLLVSILFSFFSGVLSVLSFEIGFFVSSFWQPTYILDRAAMSPGLGRVAFFSRCTVGSSGTASLFTWAGHSRCASLGGLSTPSCYSWALIAVGTSMGGITPRPIYCKHWLWPWWRICCARAHPMEQDLLQQGSGACWVCPLSVSFWRWLDGA